MQAAVAHKPEEKKETIAARAAQQPGVDALPSEEPVMAGMPLYLRAAMSASGSAQDPGAAGQAKLVVGQPDDAYEREADAVAAAAVSGAAPSLAGTKSVNVSRVGGRIQRACNCGGTCPLCRDEGMVPSIQRLPVANAVAPATSSPPLSTADSGNPLSHTVRGRVEPLLGADLSGVRVHSDSSARAAAAQLHAKAFTHQNRIWLGLGQSAEDLGLMAHEATHVVQQGHGAGNLIQRAPEGGGTHPASALGSESATDVKPAPDTRRGPYPPIYWGRERPQTEPLAIARSGARLEDIAEFVYGTPIAALDLATLNGLDPSTPLAGGVVVRLTGESMTETALGSLKSARLLPANCGDPDLFKMRKILLDTVLELDFNSIVRAIDEDLPLVSMMGRRRTRGIADIFRKWGEEKFTEYPWAYPNGGDYLDRLFLKLTNKTKILSGIITDEWTNYYSLLFNHFDPDDEIGAIRDRYSAVNRGDAGIAELSFASMFWEDLKTGKVRDRIFAFGRGAVKGVVSAAKGTAHFVKTLVTDPGQALEDLSKVPGALKSLWTHRSELFDKFANASPEEQAEMIGEFVGQLEFAIGTSPVPGAAAKGIAKLGEVPGFVGTAARALTTAAKVPGKVLGVATGAVKTIVFRGVAFAAEGAAWAARGILKIGSRILRGTWSVVEETVGAVTSKLYYFYDEAAAVLRQIQEEIAALFVKCKSPCKLTPEALEEFEKRGGTITKVDPEPMPKSQAEVTAIREPTLPQGFEDMPHGEIRTRKQAGVSLEESHHIASRYVKKNKAIFKKAGLNIDDDLNLIKDFPDHGQLRGWYDWENGSYKFNMKGHHKDYNEWVTRLLTEATPPGLAPEQALSRITKITEELNAIIQKYPEVLSHGPKISPVLEHLTFKWD